MRGWDVGTKIIVNSLWNLTSPEMSLFMDLHMYPQQTCPFTVATHLSAQCPFRKPAGGTESKLELVTRVFVFHWGACMLLFLSLEAVFVHLDIH